MCSNEKVIDFLTKRLDHTLDHTQTATKNIYLINGAILAAVYFFLEHDGTDKTITVISLIALIVLNLLHIRFIHVQHAWYAGIERTILNVFNKQKPVDGLIPLLFDRDLKKISDSNDNSLPLGLTYARDRGLDGNLGLAWGPWAITDNNLLRFTTCLFISIWFFAGVFCQCPRIAQIEQSALGILELPEERYSTILSAVHWIIGFLTFASVVFIVQLLARRGDWEFKSCYTKRLITKSSHNVYISIHWLIVFFLVGVLVVVKSGSSEETSGPFPITQEVVGFNVNVGNTFVSEALDTISTNASEETKHAD